MDSRQVRFRQAFRKSFMILSATQRSTPRKERRTTAFAMARSATRLHSKT